MYDPDENDYERLQNQWNPEDPGIIMEERYASIYDNSENNNENEADNQYYRDDNDMPPIPVYESWEDCQAKTKRDPFLKVIKAYQKKITNEKQKQEYDKFIKEYDTPCKYNVPFFTKNDLDKVWKDKEGQMHSAFYCLDIHPYNLYKLDPKLLIIYTPYFIKKYGFPSWYSPFIHNNNKKNNSYLQYIQNNCSKLKLNEIETRIVKNGYELENYDEEYIEYTEESWWFEGDEYYIDDTGHLIK